MTGGGEPPKPLYAENGSVEASVKVSAVDAGADRI
jgi:hypothetical protein